MKRRLILLLIAAAGLSAMFLADRYYRTQIRQENTQALEEVVKDFENTLSHSIRLRLAAVEDLKAFMLATPSLPDSQTFDRFAAGLLANYPTIRATQYTDTDRVIRYIYPLAGNEPALNLDLKTRPAASFVEKAIRRRRTVVQHPVVTAQGSLSIIARAPLYRDDEFLGLVQGVFDVTSILEDANDTLRPPFKIQLHDATGKQFWGVKTIAGETRTVDIPVGDNTWTLTMGWDTPPRQADSFILFLIWGGGTVLWLSVLVIVNQAWVRTAWLTEAVAERTAALQESQSRLQLAVHAANVGLWDWDLRTGKVYYSPEWKSQIGYAGDEITDNFSEWQSRVHPHDLDKALATVQAYLKDPWPNYENEFRFRHKDGSYCWILSRASLLLDEAGRPYRMLGSHIDITGHKRAEEEIRQLKEFNESIVQNMGEGIAIEDVEGYFTFVNPAAAAMLGYKPEELLGRHWTTVIPPDQRPIVQAENEQRAQGKSNRYELELLTKDGRRLHTLVSGTPRFDTATGRFAGMLAIFTDITGRVQAEAEIRRRNRELALLNRVIAASAASLEPAAILETACRELALAFDVPHAAAALLNETKTGAVVVARYLSTSSRYGLASERPPGLNEHLPVKGNPFFQYLLTHKGPLVVEDARNDPRLAPLHDPIRKYGIVSLLILPLIVDGEVVGGLGLDTSEPRHFSAEAISLAWSVVDQVAGGLARTRLAEKHRRLEEQYYQAQKMEAVGRLTGGIAHDFNNLLTAINGFAELLQMRLPPDDPYQKLVENILSSGQRAAGLVGQLMAFSRKQIIEPKIVDLNSVVTEMDKMLRRVIGEDIDLATSLAPDLWPAKVDPAQIGQVIVNLAVNARDAMPEGGRLTVETANVELDEEYVAGHLGVQPGEYVLLAVSDTGVGMSEQVKAHIFEPFFTTKEQGKGTGLGLATVYGIVKQSEGEIQVYSEEGRGTTLKIYLPRAGGETPPAAIERE